MDNSNFNIERIALAYAEAPNEIDSITQDQRIQMRMIVCKMFSAISQYRAHFDFTRDDPYKYESIKEVISDFKQGIIKVNVSGNDSELWGPVYNLMFRAVHDYVHCVQELEFTFFDEVKAWNDQVQMSKPYIPGTKVDWPLYMNVLRSEIVYQAAYKTHFGEFHVPIQKIILSYL